MNHRLYRFAFVPLICAALLAVGCQDKSKSGASAEPATQPEAAQEPRVSYHLSEKWLAHDPKPSLNGLSRADWEPTMFQTADGTVYHYNYYHRDFPTGFEKQRDAKLARADVDPTVVLDDYKTQFYTGDNSLGIVVQPLKFAFDTALMIPVMVVRPPWGQAQTPEKSHYQPMGSGRTPDITDVPAQSAPATAMSPEGTPVVPAWPVGTPPSATGPAGSVPQPTAPQPATTGTTAPNDQVNNAIRQAEEIPALKVQPSNIKPLELPAGLGE